MLAATVVASVVASAFGALPALAQAAPQVKFSTTAGDFVIEVYPDKAPKTVENFLHGRQTDRRLLHLGGQVGH